MTQTMGRTRRDTFLSLQQTTLLALLLGLLLQGSASAMDILLTATEETPSVRAFVSEVALRRPDDHVRFVQTAKLPPPGMLGEHTRLILLDVASLDWRLQDTAGPATLVLRITRVQARERLGDRHPEGLSLLWSDPPVSRQLKLIRKLLPQAHKVGVLFDLHSQFLLKELRHAAAPLGLKIVSQAWKPGDDGRPLQSLLERSDVLLGLDDIDLYNTKTAKSLLLTSNARQKALLGPTSGFVSVGSLASTYSDQLDWLNTLDTLLDQPTAEWPATLYPQHFRVLSNPRVARSLGIAPIDDSTLAASLSEAERRP